MTALVPLWIVFAVLAGLTLLCFRATQVEKAEGLAPSTRRLLVAAIAAALTGALAVYASTLRAEPPSAPEEKNDPATVAAKKHLTDLQAQQVELQKQIDELVVKIGARKAVTREDLEKNRADMQLLALEGSLLVMLLALGGVFFMGDPRTLVLRRRKPQGGARDPLDAMASACAEERWDEAMRAAATVEEAKLDGLDAIDFLYLRGIAELATKKHDDAQKDLAKAAALAPNMVEAHWALGAAYFAGERFGDAANAYARAAELDEAGAFDTKKARSAALVRHGERRLAEADVDAATKCFDEVTKLGVFTKEIPAALMSHRLASILGDLRSHELKKAREGIALVREAKSGEGLDPDRKRLAEITCSVYEMLLLHEEEEHARILQTLPLLLTAWQPADLPEPDEQAADEYLFAAVDAAKLEPRAEVFRALWFLVAVSEVRVLADRSPPSPLSDADVARIARPLFRALQFEPRHREVLAALGVLYYLCRTDRREKAIEWIDAAVAMGTTSRVARRLLELDRSRENERTALLSHFRGAATRFLGDAMVDPKVRAALLEELGRFQDFRPVLVDLDNQADIGHEAPTLAALKDRVQYIQGVAATAESRMPPDATKALRAIRDEYDAVVNTLELSASRVSDLERRVMEEVGKMVLR